MHEPQNRLAVQALGRTDQEFVPLSAVTAHVEKPGERARVHRRYQLPHTLVQLNRLGATGRSQFLDDLQQVADDHLVVSVALGVLGDGARDRRRIARRLVPIPVGLLVG